MNSFKTPSSRAFTLIELLTVIAVIGILAAIIIPTAGKVRSNAKKTKAKAQFSQLTLALTMFKQEYGYYPIIPQNKLNADLAYNATSVSDKARQMLMLELLTGKDADPSTVAFESDEKNLTSGTPRAQNKKRISFMDFSINEVKVFDQDEKAILDGYDNLDIVVLVDRNGDGIVTDDEPADTNGDGAIGTTERITEFPRVYTSDGSFIDSTTIKDTKLSVISGTTYGVRAPVVIYSAGEGDGVFSW
jgi:prepilin-type N-terminal cleavage/methylation domain-containing protein